MNKQIFCKRCKYKLGEHASFCPKCGYNNNPYLKKVKKKNNFLKILIPIIIIILGLLAGMYVIKNKNSEILGTTKEQITPSLLPFSENDKWGYMNASGKVVINPKYDWAEEFSEGMAAVMLDDKYGYINEKGEVIIDIVYDHVGGIGEYGSLYEDSKFRNGLIGAYNNNKYYMLNKDGKIVTKDYIDKSFSSQELMLADGSDLSQFSTYAYDQYYSLSEERSIYKDINNEKYGYVDAEGNVIIEAQFDWAGRFSEGLAAVVKDNLLGFINKEGKLVIDYQFDDNLGEPVVFSEGLVAVKKDGKYGYINKKGKFVIENKYTYAGEFKEGKAIVISKVEDYSDYSNNLNADYIIGLTKASYIDNEGNTILNNIKLPIYQDYSREENFSNGFLPIYKNGKVVYIDEDGIEVSDNVFDWATTFEGDVARVVIGEDSVWINNEFKVIVPYQGAMDIKEYLEYRKDKENNQDNTGNIYEDDSEIIYDTNTLIKNRVKEYEQSYTNAVNSGNFYILEPNLLYYGSMYEQFQDIVDDYYSRNLKLKLYDHRVDKITDLGNGEYRVNIYEEYGVTIDGGPEKIKKFDSIYTVKIEDGQCYMKDLNQ